MSKKERVPVVDAIGRRKPNTRPITRERANKEGYASPIICATLPILGSNKIIENLRGPESGFLPDEWLIFALEHMKTSDVNYISTLIRGLKEEFNYKINEHKIYNPRLEAEIGYELPGGKRIRKYAKFYVVPVENLEDLTPDGEEVTELRERKYQVVRKSIIRGKHLLSKTEPKHFLYGALGATEDVLSGKWTPNGKTKN